MSANLASAIADSAGLGAGQEVRCQVTANLNDGPEIDPAWP
jgi:hypothetical protein